MSFTSHNRFQFRILDKFDGFLDLAVLKVGVRTGLQQHLDSFNLILLGGMMERRVQLRINCIHLDLILPELID